MSTLITWVLLIVNLLLFALQLAKEQPNPLLLLLSMAAVMLMAMLLTEVKP